MKLRVTLCFAVIVAASVGPAQEAHDPLYQRLKEGSLEACTSVIERAKHSTRKRAENSLRYLKRYLVDGLKLARDRRRLDTYVQCATILAREVPAPAASAELRKAAAMALFANGAARDYPKGFLDGEFRPMVAGDTQFEMELFDGPHGKPVGKATLKRHRGVGHAYVIQPESHQGRGIVVAPTDHFYCGYQLEFEYLTYYEIQEDSARVLANSIPGGVWISLRPVLCLARPTPWLADITRRDKWQISGYDGFRLHEQPDLTAPVMVRLSERRHKIARFTGNTSGGWAEAVVYEVDEVKERTTTCYNTEELQGIRTGPEWRGWMKLLDDNGQPTGLDWCIMC